MLLFIILLFGLAYKFIHRRRRSPLTIDRDRETFTFAVYIKFTKYIQNSHTLYYHNHIYDYDYGYHTSNTQTKYKINRKKNDKNTNTAPSPIYDYDDGVVNLPSG
jgi:hypothetical protein